MLNDIKNVFEMLGNVNYYKNQQIEALKATKSISVLRKPSYVTMPSNSMGAVLDYSANTIRDQKQLFYKYFVKSDLVRCAIETIVMQVSRADYVVVQNSRVKTKTSTEANIRLAQSFFDSINISDKITEAIGWFALFGNEAYEIKTNQDGNIEDLSCLSWLNIEPQFDYDTGNIKEYIYNANNRNSNRTLDAKNVIHIVPDIRDPANTALGLSRMCACVDSLRCQESLYNYLYLLLLNGNYDGLFINYINDDTTDDQVINQNIQELKNLLSQQSNVGKPIITQNAQINATRRSTQTPFEGLHELGGKQVSRVFGVPEKYLNQSKSGQYGANTNVDDSDRLDEAVLSYQLPMCKAFTKKILHEMAGLYDLYLMPAKYVPIVNIDRSRSLATLFTNNVIHHTECRTMMGYSNQTSDPLKDMYACQIEQKFGVKQNNNTTQNNPDASGGPTDAQQNTDSESARQQSES